MMTMSAVPQAHINGNDSDSDDSDIAFAYTDFGGVDFGDDDDDVKGDSNLVNVVDTVVSARDAHGEDVVAAAANASVAEKGANLDLDGSVSDNATNKQNNNLPLTNKTQRN